MRPKKSVSKCVDVPLKTMMGRGVGMNGYADYEQYSSEFPGALALHPYANGSGNGMDMEAIQPELLFGAAFAGGVNGMMRGAQTAPSSEMNTPTSAKGGGKWIEIKDSGVQSGVFDPSPIAGPSTTAYSFSSLSNPAAALQDSTTLSRPVSKLFKCPIPGCMKSYKQTNGLQYHPGHGQCIFNTLPGLSERRRLLPYCCQVAPCQRRYKNMNGLMYHYQHSGQHGKVGLRMLADSEGGKMRCGAGMWRRRRGWTDVGEEAEAGEEDA